MALEALRAYARQHQIETKEPLQLSLISGNTEAIEDEAESYSETQRRTWREAYNLYAKYEQISTPESWTACADDCEELAKQGALGKHLAAAIFDTLEEISRPTPF